MERMQITATGIAVFSAGRGVQPGQPYSARQTEDHGIAIVRLSDAANGWKSPWFLRSATSLTK